MPCADGDVEWISVTIYATVQTLGNTHGDIGKPRFLMSGTLIFPQIWYA